MTKETKETANIKKEEVNTMKNENKVEVITIEEVMKLYKEFGIECVNPNAKGPYRIMGTSIRKGGSSLNIHKDGGVIYSTDEDYKAITDNHIQAEDLVLEEGTNNDKVRTNIVKFKTIDTLRKLLAVYSLNPMYHKVEKKAVEKKEVEKKPRVKKTEKKVAVAKA